MRAVIFSFAFVFSVITCRGAVITVDDDGPSDFDNIQAAINYATNGDEIIVYPGIYTGTGNRDIDFYGKAITVRSTEPNDPEIVAATVIDSKGSLSEYHRGFIFQRSEDSNSILDGLTIKNGYSDYGGAIRCLDVDDPVIKNCIIISNKAAYDGGGVNCKKSNVIMDNCTIRDNEAFGYGGGMRFCSDSQPTVINCTITGNSALDDGGGIESCGSNPYLIGCIFENNESGKDGGGMFMGENGTLTNCILKANRADQGGGIALMYYCTPQMFNCIISDNTANTGGGIFISHDCNVKITNCTLAANTCPNGNGLGIGSNGYPSQVEVTNSILWDATDEIWNDDGSTITINYCDVKGSWPGTDNIDSDPMFSDPYNGDYHLKSETGRYKPSIYIRLDPTGDGFIDLTDFAAFAKSWKNQGGFIPADLDRSGFVDFNDLTLLLNNYLAHYPLVKWVFDDVTSPCIDTGDPTSFWTPELWPHGKRINMGAFGGTPQASMSLSTIGNPADFNNDSFVNSDDLGLLAEMWLSDQMPLAEDINRDSMVNFSDWAEFANNWLWVDDRVDDKLRTDKLINYEIKAVRLCHR